MDFSHRARVIAFADDLLVLTRGKSAVYAENYANEDLKKTENWARENKMHFNENNSNVLLVTTKTSGDNGALNIYPNNKRLEQVSELKFLGIYFDSRFSFDRHVDYITGKCTPVVNVLAKFSGAPRNFVPWGGVQQIQLRTEDRENGDLGAVAP